MRHAAPALLFAFCFSPLPAGALDPGGPRETYEVSIAGIGIGEVALNLSEGGGRYSVDLDGGFRFLFWSGEATMGSEGARAEALIPAAYSARFESPSRTVFADIVFGEGSAQAAFRAEPPFDDDGEEEERAPLTPEMLVGALDPVAAFLIPAASGAEACSGARKVFSGIVRFDIELSPRAEAAGPGLTPCAAAYRPVGGHRIGNEGVSLLEEKGLNLDLFEIAPGLWAPHRLEFPTRFGALAFERRDG